MGSRRWAFSGGGSSRSAGTGKPILPGKLGGQVHGFGQQLCIGHSTLKSSESRMGAGVVVVTIGFLFPGSTQFSESRVIYERTGYPKEGSTLKTRKRKIVVTKDLGYSQELLTEIHHEKS